MFIIDDIIVWGALIAFGALLVYAIAMTISWFRDKIADKFRNKNVKKIAAGDLSTLVDNCSNQIDMSQLDEYMNEGYDNFMVSVDKTGHAVGDVELIKNTDSKNEISKLYKDEGMVVINNG